MVPARLKTEASASFSSRVCEAKCCAGIESTSGWWDHLIEDKKKAFMRQIEMKMKETQAKLGFLNEMQKIFG